MINNYDKAKETFDNLTPITRYTILIGGGMDLTEAEKLADLGDFDQLDPICQEYFDETILRR